MPIILKHSGQYPKNVRLCKQIGKITEKYSKLIGLDDSWRVYLLFHAIKDDPDVVANCVSEWHYRLVTLTFDVVKIKKKDNLDLDGVVCHELLHVPCWRIHELISALVPDKEELIQKYEEELVTFLQNMPVWKGME